MFVFNATVRTLIPHPGLNQFNEKDLEKTFFCKTSNEKNGALNKWFYFYCNPVLNPVTIFVNDNIPHLHPGLKRFIGTALREDIELSAWIITLNKHNNFPLINQMELIYEGPDAEKWCQQKSQMDFKNYDIHKYIERHVKFRWELEMNDGSIYSLNPSAKILRKKWKVSETGLINSIKEMFEECYKISNPPIDTRRRKFLFWEFRPPRIEFKLFQKHIRI